MSTSNNALLDAVRATPRRLKLFLLGERPATVPPRVEEQFRAQQYQSEILIGWVQAAGIVLFAIVYFAGPEELHVAEELKPVPMALAAYGCFVALRLFLAYRNRLSPPVIALSIVCVVIAVAVPLIAGRSAMKVGARHLERIE